jgi:hypothetical protein
MHAGFRSAVWVDDDLFDQACHVGGVDPGQLMASGWWVVRLRREERRVVHRPMEFDQLIGSTIRADDDDRIRCSGEGTRAPLAKGALSRGAFAPAPTGQCCEPGVVGCAFSGPAATRRLDEYAWSGIDQGPGWHRSRRADDETQRAVRATHDGVASVSEQLDHRPVGQEDLGLEADTSLHRGFASDGIDEI